MKATDDAVLCRWLGCCWGTGQREAGAVECNECRPRVCERTGLEDSRFPAMKVF